MSFISNAIDAIGKVDLNHNGVPDAQEINWAHVAYLIAEGYLFVNTAKHPTLASRLAEKVEEIAK